MTALNEIMAAIADCPSTAEELAAVTGIPRDSCRAHLSELHRAGRIAVAGIVPVEVMVTRKAKLYGLPKGAGVGEHG